MKTTITSLILAILGVCGCQTAASGVSRALVIGLGEQEDPCWGKINGDNDVTYVVKMLEQTGYTDIITLKNREATKQAIIDAFNRLEAKCKPHDIVYIHYSGHGQLVTDVDGDEALKWEGRHSQWDESWVPYDAYMTYCAKDRGEKHLTDDEVALHLAAIRKKIGRKGQLVVVVDSCHSGDATSGDTDGEYIRGVDTKFNIPKPLNTPMPHLVAEEWLTVSACQPYQLSGEIKDLRVGKLTYSLYKTGLGLLNRNNADIEKALNSLMTKYRGRVAQNPMVTGIR